MQLSPLFLYEIITSNSKICSILPLLLPGSRCVLAIMSGKLWKEDKHWRSGNRRQINDLFTVDQTISCDLQIHLDYVKDATRIGASRRADLLVLWFLQTTRGPQPIIKAS